MCHKNGMCPVTHSGFPVPVISITASGPQAAGACPHDTSLKQEIIKFSGETEVHGDERLPQSPRAACCRVRLKLSLTSPRPRFPEGPSRSQGSVELGRNHQGSYCQDVRSGFFSCIPRSTEKLGSFVLFHLCCSLCSTLRRDLCQIMGYLG